MAGLVGTKGRGVVVFASVGATLLAAGACGDGSSTTSNNDGGVDGRATESASGGSSGSSSGTSSGSSGSAIDSGSSNKDASSPSDAAVDVTVPAVMVCPNKVAIPTANPVFINFEGYNGATPYLGSSAFGAAPPLAGYTGPYAFSGGGTALNDAGTNWVLSMVPGRTVAPPPMSVDSGLDGGPDANTDAGIEGGSATGTDGGGDAGVGAGNEGGAPTGARDWALDLAVTNESSWGAGLGFWTSPCADATAFRGISFWVRGHAPTNLFGMTLLTADTSVSAHATIMGDAGAIAALPVTSNWTQYQIPWANFVGGVTTAGGTYTANGDNITDMQFIVSLSYAADDAGTYQPVPSDLDFQIDDIQFMP